MLWIKCTCSHCPHVHLARARRPHVNECITDGMNATQICINSRVDFLIKYQIPFVHSTVNTSAEKTTNKMFKQLVSLKITIFFRKLREFRSKN